MVQLTESNNVLIKILYWGMAGSGKTTAVDTLYRVTKEQSGSYSIEPAGNLTKIAMASGSTLYFDRGVFQSTKERKVFYHIFTVAGQKSFYPLRKKVFEGTDGVIFTVDSQTNFLEDNLESLKELKTIARGKLITEIPLIVMLNKQDLNEVVKEEYFIQLLKEERLWYEPDHELSFWNPIVYETCALFNQRREVYSSFKECARRAGLYQLYGNGKAPPKQDFLKFSKEDKDFL